VVPGRDVAERADAARNRRLILAAAAGLLASGGPGHVSIDAVAAAAGVGKGTVFRRFGSRAGLMHALIEQHVASLAESVASGPPPLGPGAPALVRLAAFLDAVVEVTARNAAIMAAYDQALAAPESALTTDRIRSVYDAWHAHVSALITEARPGLDAELLAHILLDSLHGDLARRLLAGGESGRLTATLNHLVTALLGPAVRAGATSRTGR
jgi:AcrR family transcriptional regulator